MEESIQRDTDNEYHDKHRASGKLYERSLGCFARGVTHDARYFRPMPIYCQYGKGSRKWDIDGNEYIDYWMGHGSLILGHVHPKVTEAARSQILRGTHLGSSHELEIEWAEKIQKLIPCARNGLVEFTSSGTEATMLAFRIVRCYTQRTKIVKFLSHFHGWLDYSMVDYNPSFSPPLHGYYPPGTPKGIHQSVIALPPNDIEAVEETIRNDDDIAGIILEPTGASMGYLPCEKSFLEKLREITRKNSIPLIFDEVVTGFRDAPGGAQEFRNVEPDISTLGKILGGGYPGGAVVGKKCYLRVLEMDNGKNTPRRRIRHPGTFNANPLSAAAGNACLGLVLKGRIHPKVNQLGNKLRSILSDVMEDDHVEGVVWNTSPSVVYIGLGFSEEILKCSCIEDFVKFQEVKTVNQPLVNFLNKSLINKGVHPMGSRLILSVKHTMEDIQTTAEKFEDALKEIRELKKL